MIFPSFALLSGMVLFTSAAPSGWYSPSTSDSGRVTHYVNVSNDTAGLIYEPPYIVRQPNQAVIIVLTNLSSRTPKWESASHLLSIPRTTP